MEGGGEYYIDWWVKGSTASIVFICSARQSCSVLRNTINQIESIIIDVLCYCCLPACLPAFVHQILLTITTC